jgi:phosphoribosylaminoimidazole-succinocarboxamide synthase
MKQPIPFKGQILNQLASFGFEQVQEFTETHQLEVPHPNVTIARKCDPIPIEVVIRACLTGHAWRVYNRGKRELCGVQLPDGMRENQRFAQPILTPATKAKEGHDEDISETEIIDRGIVKPELWDEIRSTAFNIFRKGQEVAEQQGLILVDTKYEFGIFEDRLLLIDEVHTADSSRYFYSDEYEQRLSENRPQKQLSKEFLREWLMDHEFQGKEGQSLPDLPDSLRMEIYSRYKELYNQLTGKEFEPEITKDFNSELKTIFDKYRG